MSQPELQQSFDRTLDVQSVLYGTDPGDAIRAARALAHSIALAAQEGLISTWHMRVGDCSPEPRLSKAHVQDVQDLIEKCGGEFHYLHFGANLGSARGHNTLASEGLGESILILNPDAVVAPDTVGALVRRLTDGVGIVEARQVPIEHPKDYDAATGDTSWASTACAVTTRKVFDEVGGFDAESFFLYCDDVDYSWRVRLAGLRVIYEPAAAVFHDKRLAPDGSWRVSAAERYYSAEAALLLALKYSRPDVARKASRALEKSQEPEALKALEEVRRRTRAGTLATPIDRRHAVAQFIAGNYAVHRFRP